LAIADLFHEAGFGDAFQNIFVDHDQSGLFIEDARIHGVTLTGSTRAGRTVYQKAAGQIKPVVLELGGSDPFIVLADADIQKAARVGARARLLNTGQSCIAAKRFIIDGSVKEDFLAELKKEFDSMTWGHQDADIGPMVSISQRELLHDQVNRSIAAGARLITGGRMPEEGTGAYYPPTILDDVKPGQPAFEEEMFGPVAAIVSVDGAEEAIRMANDTVYGLGASIFTSDIEFARELAVREIDAGNVFINEQVMSHPQLPFGGVKQSGIGRELWESGIRAFTSTKTIYLKGMS
jgi:succinate-semialdehyde dehydrogenase/glutarate-semialdehyde dehydrogenase